MATNAKIDEIVDAARALLCNAIDNGSVYVDEDNDDEDYPSDEDGDRWYQDWWDLKQALSGYSETGNAFALDAETLSHWQKITKSE